MLTLSKKLKQQAASANQGAESSTKKFSTGRASIRDRLLIGEVAELEKNVTPTCKVTFPEPDCLHEFYVAVHPDEGLWKHGSFEFLVDVSENYNITPPSVKCMTKIWHPNISEAGDVCLSLLREHSLDGTGWLPTRTLKDVVWGLNSLFTDLCDFDDPLNVDAAEQYQRDPIGFKKKVIWFIQRYAME